jgi:NAD(P)-dependent dehydrogenase (short-subunit alcohol dehydrogenase family)
MQICLITGTSTGIGHATALRLARRGYKVYATMRNTAKGDQLGAAAAAENLNLVIETLDVADNQSMLDCAARIMAAEGRIDILINNAGLSSSSPIETYPEDEHRALFEANYWGPVKLTQAVLPAMRERGSGAIINISSLLGRCLGQPGGLLRLEICH